MVDARSVLAERVFEHARRHGLGTASLREIAAAVGSSHRMLLYHFGSRDGLVAALVVLSEAAEREAMHAAVRELGPDADDEALLRRAWQRARQPRRAAQERLFFELHLHAAAGGEPAGTAVRTLARDWAAAFPPERRALARLSLGVVRGLLLDLLATGDRRAADDAFEVYIDLVRGRRTPH